MRVADACTSEKRRLPDTVAEGLDMTGSTEAITRGESELLQAESEQARGRDRQLAGELTARGPDGATSSAGYLRELSDRPRLPAGVERRLVAAAQAGDRRAREELVETFLPLIAGVARVTAARDDHPGGVDAGRRRRSAARA